MDDVRRRRGRVFSYSAAHAARENAHMKLFAFALVLVVVIVVGGLVSFLRRRREPMGTPEQLARAKQRNEQLEEQERREEDH
jgi:uncharacterized protein HemX